MDQLFAYGTLMCPDIFRTVAGISRRGEPAMISGFQRYAVRGESYPAIVPAPGCEVSGVVYGRISRFAWSRLDRFEGSMYQRLAVDVMRSQGVRLAAQVYVLQPALRHCLDDSDWDFQEFVKTARKVYLKKS
jgi:gamma-glutamylcyclotransferase (GGCT)/AIG2-like uncharacterized protein YtfP